MQAINLPDLNCAPPVVKAPASSTSVFIHATQSGPALCLVHTQNEAIDGPAILAWWHEEGFQIAHASPLLDDGTFLHDGTRYHLSDFLLQEGYHLFLLSQA